MLFISHLYSHKKKLEALCNQNRKASSLAEDDKRAEKLKSFYAKMRSGKKKKH